MRRYRGQVSLEHLDRAGREDCGTGRQGGRAGPGLEPEQLPHRKVRHVAWPRVPSFCWHPLSIHVETPTKGRGGVRQNGRTLAGG